jgi:hypothetical protein
MKSFLALGHSLSLLILVLRVIDYSNHWVPAYIGSLYLSPVID